MDRKERLMRLARRKRTVCYRTGCDREATHRLWWARYPATPDMICLHHRERYLEDDLRVHVLRTEPIDPLTA